MLSTAADVSPPTRPSWSRRQPQSSLRAVLWVASAYFVLSYVAAVLNDHNAVGSVTRPAAGLAVAAMLLVPPRRWVFVLVGLVVGQLAFGVARGAALAVVVAAGVAIVIEALAAGVLMRRFGNPDGQLAPTRNLVVFLLCGVVAAPMLAAVPALTLIELAGGDVLERVPHLVLSDMLGVLIFAPLVLAPPARLRRSWIEAAALATAVLSVSFAVFFQLGRGWGVTLPYVLLPLLLWAAFRFGTRATALCGVGVLAIANLALLVGSSPFNAIEGSSFERSIALRSFLAVAVAVALLVAAVVDDLVDSRQVQRALRVAALTDPLTGLPNRLSLEQVLEQHDGSPVTLLMCDLDNFKRVNDGYGHHAGDDLLVEVARRLQRCVRTDDELVRLGGDEFVVLLPGDDAAQADRVAQRVLAELSRPHLVSERVQIVPSVSIGIASSDGSTVGDLLRHADAALYSVKSSPGQRVGRFDRTLQRRLESRRIVESDIDAALAEGQLRCEFQPQLCIGTDRVFAVEALVRWDHPEHGLLMPGEFVGIVEQLGLADDLFRAVLRESLAWQRRWLERRAVLVPISVNLSPLQLTNTELVESIEQMVGEAGAAPGSVCFEITEGVLIQPDSMQAVSTLSDLGFSIAIDDFGTGWASMARLAAFGWDLLKVDRSFVADIGRSPHADAIIGSAIALGHSLGMLVVAEGVEHAEQHRLLAELGCDIVQGFHFSRPLRGEVLSGHLDDDGHWRSAASDPTDDSACDAIDRSISRLITNPIGSTSAVPNESR